jgi:hypothetical protein
MKWLGLAQVLASILMVVRLRRTALHRRYRVLFAYFVFLIPFTSVPLFLNLSGRAYFLFWELSEPLLWVLEILVVRELCGLVLERHKGLYRAGRWAMYFGLAVASTISGISLLSRSGSTMGHRSKLLFYTMSADQAVNFTLAIFLVLMLFFVSRYPVALSRNVVLNMVLFTLFFLCNTVVAILHAAFDLHLSATIDASAMALSCICQLFWVFALNREGENVPLELRNFTPEHEKRVLFVLNSLNNMALKMYRKN